jgi:hypothetical protein
MTETRRIFPSTLAAIVTGAVLMPFFLFGWRLFETAFPSQTLVLLWFVIAFFVPVILATADLKYVARRRCELGGLFRPMTSPDDFRLFYRPAWRRIFVLFVSNVVAVVILKTVGVEL